MSNSIFNNAMTLPGRALQPPGQKATAIAPKRPKAPAKGDYRQVAIEKAQKYGIDPNVFLNLINAESSWNPNARSAAGAIGLGQLMPDTARSLGVDPHDPIQNLDGAARYLAQQYKTFGNDYSLALAAYNAGPGNVRKYGGIPPFQETRAYVNKILGGSSPKVASSRDPQYPTVNPMQPVNLMNIGPVPNAQPEVPTPIGTVASPSGPVDPSSMSDPLSEQIAQHQALLDDLMAEKKSRNERSQEIQNSMFELLSRPAPEPAKIPENGGITKQDSQNMLLGSIAASVLGVKPRAVAAGVEAFAKTKSDSAMTKYQNEAQSVAREAAQRQSDYEALAQSDVQNDKAISSIDTRMASVANKLLETQYKVADSQAKDARNLTAVIMDPKRSSGDKLAAFGIMRAKGLLSGYTPEDLALLSDNANKNGAELDLRLQKQKLDEEVQRFKVNQENWKREFEQSKLGLEQAKMNQQLQIHREKLKQEWTKFTQSENNKMALENYKTLSSSYSTMATQVNGMRSDVAKNRAILNAAEQDIREQRNRIGRMPMGAQRDAAMKQVEADSEKVRKAKLEQDAKEKMLIQMAAELETMKPPPLAAPSSK